MKKLIKSTLKIAYGLGFLFLAVPAFAAETINLSPTGEFNKLVQITFQEMVPVIIRVIMIIATLVALLFLILGGIKWITSGGDKAAAESARGTITNAVIGLVIVFATMAILRLIEIFFNIKLLSFEVPNIPLVNY